MNSNVFLRDRMGTDNDRQSIGGFDKGLQASRNPTLLLPGLFLDLLEPLTD